MEDENPQDRLTSGHMAFVVASCVGSRGRKTNKTTKERKIMPRGTSKPNGGMPSDAPMRQDAFTVRGAPGERQVAWAITFNFQGWKSFGERR